MEIGVGVPTLISILLQIQMDESLRSYVERNLHLGWRYSGAGKSRENRVNNQQALVTFARQR